MKQAPKRVAWIDIARGIGIILVVYGHVLRGLASAHILSTSNPIWASDYTIYTFHMPLFFVLAGLHVERSLAKGTKHFLSDKVRTIAYPYLLWSLFQGAVQLLVPGLANSSRSLWSLATILWHPIAQFWFLYVLFLCHLLALLTRARHLMLIPLMSIGLALAIVAPHHVSSELALVFALSHWFLFYAAGILLSHFLLTDEFRLESTLGCATLAAILLAFLSQFGRVRSGGNPDAMESWPSAIAGIVLIICMSLVSARAHNALTRTLKILGQASLTIYIFHILAAAAIRVALLRMHISDWLPQLVIGTTAGISLPFFLHLWLHHLDLLRALGLGPKRSAQDGEILRKPTAHRS